MTTTIINAADYFNSIKVQLIPNEEIAKHFGKYLFQFHKGTINTCFRMMQHFQHYDFNSIKVQLILKIIS